MQTATTWLVFVCVVYQSARILFADAGDGKSYTLTFFKQQMAIRKNRLLTTLAVLPKEFDISFDLYPTKWGPPFHKSILRMTSTGSNCCGIGSRIPAVLGHYGSIGVYFALNGGGSTCLATHKQPTKKWIHVRIAQIREKRVTGDIYIFAVYLNHKLWRTMENRKPQEFRNVKVFAGDQFYSPQPGFLKNLQITAIPFAVDGKWGPWGEYSECSKECGGGVRKRTRTCTKPRFGGKPCGGSAVQSEFCNTQACHKARCRGIDNGCCTASNPCEEADGDCDTDEQCVGSLVCGTDNCGGKPPFDSTDDCCMKPTG